MTELESSWRAKSDTEVAAAGAHIEDYSPEGQLVIRAEFTRRGMTLSSPQPEEEFAKTSSLITSVGTDLPSSNVIFETKPAVKVPMTKNARIMGLFALFWCYVIWFEPGAPFISAFMIGKWIGALLWLIIVTFIWNRKDTDWNARARTFFWAAILLSTTMRIVAG